MDTKELYEIFCKHPIISTDTRKIEEGSLYFALKGANFDGNKFSHEAIEKGAAYTIIDDTNLKEEPNHIWVEDVLSTLQLLANFHRNKLGIPIIGITGSNGKTTTKELIAAVLKKKFSISFTQGNLNNHIGVPLTLLSMNAGTEIGIVEMGANHPGEIAFLCQIAEPDFGLITNVGKAHLEGFGSFKGVIKTKAELYDFLREKRRPCFINIDNNILVKQAQGLELKTYGKSENADLRGLPEESDYYLTVKTLFPKGWLYLKSKMIGSYNFENILAAARVGIEFDIDPLQIQKAIAEYQPSNNRSQLVTKGTNRIIMDAYNANPTSMAASLTNFFNIKHPKKMIILGDMLELGSDSAQEHQNIVNLIEGENLNEVYLVGKLFLRTTTGSKIKKFEHVELLSEYLYQQNSLEKNLVLIKGSRGVQLEKILGIL